jgi:hypothetical protein
MLVRIYGVRSFTADPECILRIGSVPSILRQPVTLPDGTVLALGDKVIELHFWNEHLPVINDNGADMLMGWQFTTRLVHSFRVLAEHVLNDPGLRTFAALHGRLGFIQGSDVESLKRPAARLGLLLELHDAAGLRFWRGAFWAGLYSWWLMWTFNPGTLRRKRFRDVALSDLWMTRETLLARYGPAGTDSGIL